MKVFTPLLVCALAFASVANAFDVHNALRKGCESADDAPAPVHPQDQVTPAPAASATPSVVPETPVATPETTTKTPSAAQETKTGAPAATPETTTPTPEATTAKPAATPDATTATPAATPETTTKTPAATPETTTTSPEPIPETTTAAPAPAPEATTAAPPVVVKKDAVLPLGSSACAGYVRLAQKSGAALSTRKNCVLDFSVKFSSLTEAATDACVVCDAGANAFVFDATAALDAQTAPLCGGKPLCTDLRGYLDVTVADILCVLHQNGAAPVEDAAACSLYLK